MNFKRNCFKIITLMSAVFTVAGCSKADVFVKYEPIEEVVDNHETITALDGSYVRPGDYASYPALDKDGNTVNLGSAYEVLSQYSGQNILEATGDKKMLVVPVDFSDYTTAQLGVSNEEYISNLEKAFFGSAKNNKFCSVAEYYNKSSYGKLRISGKVCDKFYTFSKTIFEIERDKTIRDVVQDQYNKVLNWYDETYHESLDEYRIDPSDDSSDVVLYLVYTLPIELREINPDFFWAYTFNDKPLSWTSYSVMNTLAGYPDSHTFIHETGHLFGLVDYYPIEKAEEKNTIEPTGRIDMMDCSVGDHSGLSKMWLNWARPYWVKDSCEITIKALVDSGELILINDLWNGSVFDEYYLIEFYSPTGLNYFDTNIGNNYAKLPTLPGVKIYHVDARLGYYALDTQKKPTFKYYCDEEQKAKPEDKISPNKTTKNVKLVHDNVTYTDAKDNEKQLKNYLYELQLNHVGHSAAGCATNFHLFRQGDSLEDLVFNSNKLLSHPDYKIAVSGLTYRDATIKIEKIENN